MDIYRAAKRRGKYQPLATDTDVNSCFSIYQNSEHDNKHHKQLIWMISSLVTMQTADAIFSRVAQR